MPSKVSIGGAGADTRSGPLLKACRGEQAYELPPRLPGQAVGSREAGRFATNTPHRISLRLMARLLRLPLKGGVVGMLPSASHSFGRLLGEGSD